MKDFKCNLNCPAVNGIFIDGICCNNCYRTKKKYLNDSNRHLWTEWDGRTKDTEDYINGILKARRDFREGFYDPEIGCRLSREDMPEECRSYDCKNDRFYMCEMKYTHIKWDGQEWKQVKPVTLYARGVIIPNHFDALFNSIKRDIVKFCNHDEDAG